MSTSSVSPLPALSIQNTTIHLENFTDGASKDETKKDPKGPVVLNVASKEEDSDISFDQSIQNTRLLGEYLVADCRGLDGKIHKSSLSLDTILGHSDGNFIWGGHGFCSSARDISLTGLELNAKLPYKHGWVSAKIDLRDHIRLKDGKLESFDIEVNPK